MLTIKRLAALADHTRKYTIVLDGKDIGHISNGKTEEINIKPGRHELYLKIDYARSRKVTFNSTNDDIVFHVQSALAGPRLILAVLYAALLFNRYITIKQQ